MATALAAHGNLGLRASSALTEEALAFAARCDDYLTQPAHALAPVRERYVRALAERGALDYGGLQRDAVALLEQDEAARRLAGEFRYVLVDEYQDTNVAQERLLELVAGTHRNVFAVADEDQSIYGFRGSEIENALRFEERWPGARRYDLPTNYRSAARIVHAAASVIKRNVDTHRDKPLEPVTGRAARLRGETFRHAAEEADWIAREVARLRLEGLALGEVAVLARSLREIGPRLAYAFRRHAIPFHAPLATPLHPTAAALLALLELATAYPWDERDNDAALRTLASPLFAADPLELRAFRRVERTLYGALRDSGRFDDFFEALAIVKRQTSAGSAVWALWQRIDHFRELEARIRTDATSDDVDELAAVTALSDAANEFDDGPADFAAAYRAGRLDSEEPLAAGDLPTDAVALLTVHQAKGLEWEAVFICDLVEGRFPALARSQNALFDRDDFTTRPLTETERARRALEEERRLFYVALTRARTRVLLSATEESREEAGRALSRFYGEVEPFLDAPDDEDSFVSAEEALAALRRAGGGPTGWRELPETANLRPMLAHGGLYTSATGLAPYENCPLQFFLGTMLELVRPSGASLDFGSILHDVLEAFHDPERGEPHTLERLLELASKMWRPGRIRPAPFEAEYRRRLERMLRDYYASGLPAPGSVLAVERRFRVEFDGTTLTGRIDRIDRRDDGTLSLVDYKSSKSAMTQAQAAEDLQLALYAVACGTDDELRALGRVGELTYVYPRVLARGQVVRRSQPVTEDLEDRTRERIRALVGEIAAERFDFSPDADCTFCDFRRICPRHVAEPPV